MPAKPPEEVFNQQHAAEYDQRNAKLAPLWKALHLLLGAVFYPLPTEARILCVGAGTGAEILALARRFPHWRFTAVDPSGPMLEVCRRRTAEAGIADRCEFHLGYVDTLPAAPDYDAATALLVSQFILEPEARTRFFRDIAARLRPGGYLASADLASGFNSADYETLLEIWLQLMKQADRPAEQVEKMRAAYGRDVAISSVAQIGGIMKAAGFANPVMFLQTGLIHAWYARRN